MTCKRLKIRLVLTVLFSALLSYAVSWGHDDVIGPHFGGDGTIHDNRPSIKSLQSVHIKDYAEHHKVVVTEDEIVKALQLARKHLSKSTWLSANTLEYRTPAEELRKQANDLEQRDKDIDYILGVLERLEI
jgi:hypothetical protein